MFKKLFWMLKEPEEFFDEVWEDGRS